MVAQCRAAAGPCGVPYEAVTTVASPAHHAVDMAAALRGDGAMEWRVWGGAIQGWKKKKENKKRQRFEMTSHKVLKTKQKGTFYYYYKVLFLTIPQLQYYAVAQYLLHILAEQMFVPSFRSMMRLTQNLCLHAGVQ